MNEFLKDNCLSIFNLVKRMEGSTGLSTINIKQKFQYLSDSQINQCLDQLEQRKLIDVETGGMVTPSDKKVKSTGFGRTLENADIINMISKTVYELEKEASVRDSNITVTDSDNVVIGDSAGNISQHKKSTNGKSEKTRKQIFIGLFIGAILILIEEILRRLVFN